MKFQRIVTPLSECTSMKLADAEPMKVTCHSDTFMTNFFLSSLVKRGILVKWSTVPLLQSRWHKSSQTTGWESARNYTGGSGRMIERLSFFVRTNYFTVSEVFILWQLTMNNTQADAVSIYFNLLNQHAPNLNCFIKSRANEVVWSNNYFITDLWITARQGTLMDVLQCLSASSFLQTLPSFHWRISTTR